MIDLLDVYECPQCGDILSDQIIKGEAIDTDNDEVYPYTICKTCNNEVTQKIEYINDEPSPVLRSVDHERWLWAIGHYQDQEEFL